MSKEFENAKLFFWIERNVGEPTNFENTFYKKVLIWFKPFDMFVINWIISNFYALKKILKYKGLILPYEWILTNPIEAQDLLETFLKINLNTKIPIKRQNYFKYPTAWSNKFFKVLKNTICTQNMNLFLMYLKKNLNFNIVNKQWLK